MANKRYADIAAARHMSIASMTDDPLPPETPVSMAPLSGSAAIPAPASRPVRTAHYRRQRAAAVAVISLVIVSVPTLAVLLFIYG